MKVEVSLFGMFREHVPGARVVLEVSAPARIADLRSALAVHGREHWPGFKEGLLRHSAFASEVCVLRDHEPVPEGARIVVLPPVSGG